MYIRPASCYSNALVQSLILIGFCHVHKELLFTGRDTKGTQLINNPFKGDEPSRHLASLRLGQNWYWRQKRPRDYIDLIVMK